MAPVPKVDLSRVGTEPVSTEPAAEQALEYLGQTAAGGVAPTAAYAVAGGNIADAGGVHP